MAVDTKELSLKQQAGILLREVQAIVGLPWYSKPQLHQAQFSVTVESKSDNNRIDVIIPVPPTTDYQTLVHGLAVSDESLYQLGKEPKYDNEFLHYSPTLQTGETVSFESVYKVQVSPRNVDVENPIDQSNYINPNSADLEEDTFINPYILQRMRLPESLQQLPAQPNESLQRINRYVIDRLQYGDPLPGLYSVYESLDRERVDCGGFDTLFVSICRSAGIPARVISGFWAGYTENTMHAWIEAMLPDNRWAPFDPSVEQLFRQSRTYKYARAGYVGSDRIAMSVGSDLTLSVRGQEIKTPILQNPIIVASNGDDSFVVQTNFTVKKGNEVELKPR